MAGRGIELVGGLSPTLRGMLWMGASGALFSVMNTAMKAMSHDLDPWVVGCLRYSFGFLVLTPLIWRIGPAACMTRAPLLQIARGGLHACGMLLWFIALPSVSMAELTAIGFTGPIFICLGAVLFLGERMTAPRVAAVATGFLGVLIVVQPWSQGAFTEVTIGNLFLLGAAPLFAASFLVAKVLTRVDRPEVVVFWQHLTVGLLLTPFALAYWTPPSPPQWAALAALGVLGSLGHYCMTRAFRVADISSVQSVSFLNLVWASIAGYVVFAAIPGLWTLIGAAVIFASTILLARHEAQAARAAAPRAAA
ncbi:DMT family transporter [Desertibaculum subflavum]|uniref:DMT family transporter n=1 Tax=Desertibaculum subflavum TaxID=2268458 RepID=UPI0013C48986